MGKKNESKSRKMDGGAHDGGWGRLTVARVDVEDSVLQRPERSTPGSSQECIRWAARLL
jgi:hypothetical protein